MQKLLQLVRLRINFLMISLRSSFKIFFQERDPSTSDFIFQQTMYRIKDPKASLEFYTGVLGMRLLKKLDFPAMTFSLYFLGFESEDDIPKDEKVSNVKY